MLCIPDGRRRRQRSEKDDKIITQKLEDDVKEAEANNTHETPTRIAWHALQKHMLTLTRLSFARLPIEITLQGKLSVLHQTKHFLNQLKRLGAPLMLLSDTFPVPFGGNMDIVRFEVFRTGVECSAAKVIARELRRIFFVRMSSFKVMLWWRFPIRQSGNSNRIELSLLGGDKKSSTKDHGAKVKFGGSELGDLSRHHTACGIRYLSFRIIHLIKWLILTHHSKLECLHSLCFD